MHIACSGGADSIALLGLLHLLAPRDRLVLTVGHIDHGLRPESEAEARGVVAVAQGMGLAVEVATLELSRGAGLPARARDARRQALQAQARGVGATFVVLGHTATDQAETVLLHLARGAGLEGLAAMADYEPWQAGTPGGWVRPMLDLSRARTRSLAVRLGHRFVDDPTNDEDAHPRVRVRQHVLPSLAAINPRVEEALARSAAHARQAEDALGIWVDRELRSRRRPPRGHTTVEIATHVQTDVAQAHADTGRDAEPDVTPGSRWSTEGMERLPSAIRTRFVRRVCQGVGAPDDALSARTLASVDDALASPGPARTWDLHPSLRLCIALGELWAETRPARDPREQPLTP